MVFTASSYGSSQKSRYSDSIGSRTAATVGLPSRRKPAWASAEARSLLVELVWSRMIASTSLNSASVASMVLPLPGAPTMRTGTSKRSSRRLCLARNVVSGEGLTIARKEASSRMYSVARRRKGFAIAQPCRSRRRNSGTIRWPNVPCVSAQSSGIELFGVLCSSTIGRAQSA